MGSLPSVVKAGISVSPSVAYKSFVASSCDAISTFSCPPRPGVEVGLHHLVQVLPCRAALAASVGFQVALIVVGFDPSAPYSHVWATVSPPFSLKAQDGRQVWIELDVTRPAQIESVPMDRIHRTRAVPVC